MDNKKVALFIPALNGGGAEKMMIHLANYYYEEGWNIDLIVGDFEGPYKSLINKDMNIINLNVRKGIAMLPGMIGYLINKKPAVILSALETSNLVSIWAKVITRSKVRVVISERNHVTSAAQNPRNYTDRLLPLLTKLFYRFADQIVSVSKGVEDDLKHISRLPQEKFTTIYNPVVTAELLKKADEPIDHPWFNAGVPILLAVGRLVPQKDFETLIRALSTVLEKKEVRLIILGEGPERENLQTLISELKLDRYIDLRGFVNNPYPYMNHAELFVLSSAWEGFGNVLVEAMACGTPVVSTNCLSGPSEILNNGEYGSLVKVGDYKEMAKSIINTINVPIDSKVLKKRANEFTLPIIAQKYKEVLFNEFK